MYKESMDGATLLFIGDTYAKAYNISYLNRNYNKINSNLQTVKKIYYKCNESRNSWINYKKALTKEENRNLSYVDRIILGIKNDFLSDEEFQAIPETEYTDYAGYTYTIGARDGLDSPCNIKQLTNILSSNITKKIEFDTVRGCKKLTVNFKSNIDNSLITFNGLFEPYEKTTENNCTSIIYYEENDFELPKDDDGNYYEDWCFVIPYKWEGITINETNEHPIKRDNEWLIFDNSVDSSCLLIYNKVLYDYTINTLDDHYIKISDSEDVGNSNNFELEDIRLIRLTSDDGLVVKQQKLEGFYNESDMTVYFPDAIDNALITYNGMYHKYFIKPDRKSIKFKIPGDLVLDVVEGIDESSLITAINFYTGDVACSIAEYSKTDLAKAANAMLNTYKNKLLMAESRVSELEKKTNLICDDYVQQLYIDTSNPNIFKLDYIPDEKSIRLSINGVEYDKDLYFTYTEETKEIEWTFTAFNNGFDLDSSMDITATYDYYYSVNNITDDDED
jgi:hypothetical protein